MRCGSSHAAAMTAITATAKPMYTNFFITSPISCLPDQRELVRIARDPELSQQLLEVHDPLLSCLEFLIISDHGRASGHCHTVS